ncbi:GNAT family N-acetyltransferase [Microbacterium sp. MYb62]|uniref:GNAT family N-acetyltransferase n=1 Tax=Microbacterium sp. MYb62 TaxID=1848690 RepID=UPI000CFD9F02|nr:GNAT family N-acetyltransferase [Microbacterium sp. MYb62]PRB15939.1 GNAT family N-acetyltransferase [Microbacterium sp. MYb62]
MRAEADAEAAQRASGLRIRLLDRIEEHAAVRALIEEVWHAGEGAPPVTADLLSAIRVSGGYVSGAFDEQGLAAASLGFFGPPSQRRLHSHITGALARTRGTGIGHAMKLHQRAWALREGVETITWTFDPLVRRNAYFNIVKLGASVTDYLPDLYGAMDDAINRDDITDRALARWPLTHAGVVAAASGRTASMHRAEFASAVVALRPDPSESPVLGDRDADLVLIGIPADIESMRATDSAKATAWRLAVRATLGTLLDEGAVVRGFDRDGWYILDRTETP